MVEEKKVDIDKLNVASIVERMKGETPDFWKKVRKAAVWIVGTAGSVLLAAPLSPVAIPAGVITVCGYIVFGGTVLGLSSTMAVKPKTEDQ